jgi:hypothetical protein
VVFAQTDKEKKYFSLSINYDYGNILMTNPFVEGANKTRKPIEHYQALSLKALWQNPGYTDWQKVYRGPYYGLGLTVGDFYNTNEIGYPISYYGILGIPIKRWKKLELYSEFQFGLTSNWVKYDSITNPYNIVIGGGLTVHLNIGVNAYFPITKNLDLGTGLHFLHFSNGGMERPNRGFNLYTASAELKYHFGEKPKTKAIKSPGKLERSNDLYFMMGYGNHQLVEHELDSNYFAIGGLSAIYFHQFSNAFRLGAGTDFNYWWGLNANPDGTIGPRTMENLTIGLILQPEMIIDRLTIVGGIGIYARHLHYGSFNQTYQRLGVRYDVYKNWSFGVNVRAVNFMLAEFMEFNLGYRIRWKK